MKQDECRSVDEGTQYHKLMFCDCFVMFASDTY